MGRRFGLGLFVLIAGCDAEVTRLPSDDPPVREPTPEPDPTDPQLKDPNGPLPDPDPSYRSLDVHLVRLESGAPARGVEVLSHDGAGVMIDRLQTDEAGHAPIDVEDGGTVSILWENRFSDDSPLRNVVTFRVTPGLEALNRALQGLQGEPNPPVDVVLDIEPVPGQTQYAAQLSCSAPIVTAELPIVFSEYTGCPGEKTFSAIVRAGEGGNARSAVASNLTLPEGGSVTHTLSLLPSPTETFSVTLVGMPAESYAFAWFERTTEGLHGPSWSATDAWTDGETIEWTGELPQLDLPVAIGVHASFPVTPGCVRGARWDGLVADPVSLQWNPDRLASATITDGVLALGEGDTPDFGSIGFGGEVEDHHRSMSFYFPWGPEAVGAVPNAHVELPPDLEALYGFDGEPDTVIAHDVLGADGYDAALAADPRALREWASSRECAR